MHVVNSSMWSFIDKEQGIIGFTKRLDCLTVAFKLVSRRDRRDK